MELSWHTVLFVNRRAELLCSIDKTELLYSTADECNIMERCIINKDDRGDRASGVPRILSWEGLIKKIVYYIRCTTAPKSQDQMKWLLSDGSTGGLVISKALIPQP